MEKDAGYFNTLLNNAYPKRYTNESKEIMVC